MIIPVNDPTAFTTLPNPNNTVAMAALEQVLWEESFANKRSRLMTENCQASLQVQSLEDLNRFISDSLEPFVKDSCIRSLARFAASLKGLVSFFNAVKVASQSAEGPLLIWSWTHALIVSCFSPKHEPLALTKPVYKSRC